LAAGTLGAAHLSLSSNATTAGSQRICWRNGEE
jgi:hypothetical protein